ncbi:MAG: hypothetical protein HKN58_00315 [Xanthomonadales bacterium]|nr:hypothetical protein [Xanthomonadales bacterium]
MLTEADRSLCDRDPDIPGLRALLDDATLAQWLGAQSGESGTPRVQCDYLRYKAGVNCIARLRIATPNGERLAYAKAFNREGGDKLDKALAKHAVPGAVATRPLLFAKDMVVIREFPNDARLPSLSRLGDPGQRAGLLARLFKGLDGWDEPQWEILSYKPERRVAARFSNAAGEQLAVKFYREDEFDRIRKYRKRLADDDGVPVARWLGGSKAHCALVFAWLDGRPLSAVGRAGRKAALISTGQALAQFHASEQPGLAKRNRAKATRKLISVASGLENILPEMSAPATRLANSVGRWHRRQAREKIPVHGDFDATQAVVAGSVAKLIDSDEAHLGNAVSDLACFRARAELASILDPDRAPDPEQEMEILLEGYRSQRDVSLEQLPAYTAWHLLHLLHAPFRSRAPDWPARTEQLLERCQESWREA